MSLKLPRTVVNVSYILLIIALVQLSSRFIFKRLLKLDYLPIPCAVLIAHSFNFQAVVGVVNFLFNSDVFQLLSFFQYPCFWSCTYCHSMRLLLSLVWPIPSHRKRLVYATSQGCVSYFERIGYCLSSGLSVGSSSSSWLKPIFFRHDAHFRILWKLSATYSLKRSGNNDYSWGSSSSVTLCVERSICPLHLKDASLQLRRHKH